MNILVIHEVDWLKKVVFEIHNISEQMSLLGHTVYAVDYEDTWQKDASTPLFSMKTTEYEAVSRTIEGGKVHLIRPGFVRLPGLSRFSASITHYLAINKILTEKQIDVILLYSVPTNGLQTIYLARKYGVPVVFRSIDILYRMVKYPWLRPATRFLEKRVYRNVDKILAIAPRYARYVSAMGAPKERVKLVLMPIDTSLFSPGRPDRKLMAKWDFEPKDRLITFIGTLFEFSGMDKFIRQMPLILENEPRARLLIVGDGPQRQKLERIIDELKLRGKVVITGFQPYHDMPRYINMADICINTFVNNPATEDIFPGKVIQYLSCGKATVATPLKGLTRILPEDSGAIVYAEGEQFAKAITALLDEPNRCNELGLVGLSYARSTHSYKRIARQFEAELYNTLKSSNSRKI